jgi:hypothetical protein
MRINEPTETVPVVLTDDGFDEGGSHDRLIQGSIGRCVDGRWTIDGIQPAGDKCFIGLGTAEAVQCWRDEMPIETIVKKAGMPLPDIAELNAKIPRSQWEDGLNGQRPPWVRSFIAYFLDPADGSIWTYINSTVGARIAVQRLRESVHWMRQLRGERVVPVVALASRPMKTKFGQKLRPEFVIKGWRDLGSGRSTAPQQLVNQDLETSPVDHIRQPVDEPSNAEILDDKVRGGQKVAGDRR